MTISQFTAYPEKGPYSDDKRRVLNATIDKYVNDVIALFPAYATTTWYKDKYTPLVTHADFGRDHNQNLQAQLCVVGLQARGSFKELYEELIEHVPYLMDYLTVSSRAWALEEPSQSSMAAKDFASIVTVPPTTPTTAITEALGEHKDKLESTLKGLDEATGVARGRRNLQHDFDDDEEDDDGEDEDQDDEEEEVLDFNQKWSPTGDNDEDEFAIRDIYTQTIPKDRSSKATKQLTLTQLADPDSDTRIMLKTKRKEKTSAKTVRTTAEEAIYRKMQGKATEQAAINKALKESLEEQKMKMEAQRKQSEDLKQKLELFLKTGTQPALNLSSNTAAQAVKPHPQSLTDPANVQLAQDFLVLNPNKNSNKFFSYFHEGIGYIMQPQNYEYSRLPKMKIKYYVDTIGLMRNITIHAAQFGIFINQIEDIEAWDDRSSNPPTCPYNDDLTYECDKVYTIAANKIYTKLSNTIKLLHPVLQQSFNEAGQYADGFIALYYLQSYGNPKFRDRSVDMPKPELGNSRDITLFCRNLHNYSMYKTLTGDAPTKLNLYEYMITQINENFPGEYTKGIKDVEDKINVWRALSKNPAIGPTQPFPQEAEIEGGNFAFAIMRKYTEAEARTLFQRDEGNDDEEDVIIIDKVEAEVMAMGQRGYDKGKPRTSRYNTSDYQKGNNRNQGGWNDRNSNNRTQGGWNDKNRSQRRGNISRGPDTKTGYTPWKYREGVYCSMCGGEGHEAKEDGCFATGRFLRMIKNIDTTTYKRIKDKYGDLVKTIDRKLQDSIDNRASRRKERNAKVTYMELADKAWEVYDTDDDAREICINCAYSIFPDIASDSDDENYEDAEQSA